MMRGNPHVPGQEVHPAFPSLFEDEMPPFKPPREDAETSGRRTVLANWIASPDNRLTARVMVNRIWHHHFGRGIVASTSNFGQLGTPPTHPELLDWLASGFMCGCMGRVPAERVRAANSCFSRPLALRRPATSTFAKQDTPESRLE
jgi:hypothetical protein